MKTKTETDFMKYVNYGILTVCMAVFLTMYIDSNKKITKLQKENDSLKTINYNQKLEIDSFYYRTKFSNQSVKYWIHWLAIRHEDIVFKQFLHETGNGKSNVCINKHNLFGITNGKGKYQTFDNFIECICYYKNLQWQRYRGDFWNENYYDILKENGYAEDKDYVKKLKQMGR